MAQLKLTDEPIKQLKGLQEAMRTVKCNKQSRQYYQMLDEHLSVLTPAMEKQISSMIDAASFGETLKQGQLKALQVSRTLRHQATAMTNAEAELLLLSSGTERSSQPDG